MSSDYPFRSDSPPPPPTPDTKPEQPAPEPQQAPAPSAPSSSAKAKQGKTPLPPRPERDELSVPETMPPSLYSRIFSFLSVAPFIWLLLVLAAQTVFSLDARDLWFSDEVRHGNAFQNLLAHGKWLLLEMNGQPYPDKPPLYFLFLQGLHYLIPVEGPRLYLAAAAVSGGLYLLATLALGKFVAGVDKRTRLASGLILLLCGYVYGTVHYARMDLLFSAFIIMAHVCLYRALVRERATGLMLLAFLFCALAVLTKGPLGIILPLVSGICFTFWLGRPRRLLSRDMLFGLVLFALLVGAWVGAIIWETGGTDYFMKEILGRQVAERAVSSFAHREPWHYYFVRLPLAWLPWTLVIFFLPWHRLFGASMRQAVAEARTPQKDGLAYLWIMFLSGFVVLTASSAKIIIYFLPVFPAMAVLTARAVLQMSKPRATAWRWGTALFLLLAGLALIWATAILTGSVAPPAIKGLRPWPPMDAFAGYIIAGVLLFAFAWTAFGLRSSRPEGVLMVLLVTNLAFTYPMCNMLAPALDPVMSPKGQAELLKSFTDQGYYPASYREYSGTWTYYSGVNTDMLDSLDKVAPLMETHPRLILGTRAKEWDKWAAKPEGLTEIDRRWIADGQWVLAAAPVGPDNAPLPKEVPAPPVLAGEGLPGAVEAPEGQPAPELPGAAVNATIAAPQTNGTAVLPGVNATQAAPQTNATIAAPQVNATEAAPQANATAPATPAGVPEANATAPAAPSSIGNLPGQSNGSSVSDFAERFYEMNP